VFPQDVDKIAHPVDNFLRSFPIISKKSLVFKAFSGGAFEEKLQFIHNRPAGQQTVFHNILW